MLLLVAPFYLNDFAFILLNGTYGVYLADYSTRILVLFLCFLIPLSRKIITAESTYIWRPDLALSFVILLPILGRLIHHLLEIPVIKITDNTGLFQFIIISDPFLYWLDLTFGLLLVAISEELVFRKFMLKFLEFLKLSYWKILFFSAMIFSLMHWSNGPGRILYCFVGGLIYMAAYYKIKRVWPLVLAHWIEDFIAFGGLD